MERKKSINQHPQKGPGIPGSATTVKQNPTHRLFQPQATPARHRSGLSVAKPKRLPKVFQSEVHISHYQICGCSVRNCFRAGDDQLEIDKAAGELSQEKKDAFLIVNTRTTPDEQNKQRSNLLAFFPKRPELGFNRGMVNAIRSRGPMTSFNASGQTAKAARVKEMYHTLSPYMRELFLRC